MNERLPEAFVNRMREQLGSELPSFLHALEEPPLRGIRFNPMKQTAAAEVYATAEPIPWQENAYYLPADSEAGRSVLQEAGAYYIQEPGAMAQAMKLPLL